MRNKQMFPEVLLAGATICVLLITPVQASTKSAFLGLTSNSPAKVFKVDGISHNSSVTARAWFGSPSRTGFDFGSIGASLYVPITDQPDFSLKSKGTDGLFSAANDEIYRLSDNANYVRERYFSAIKPSRQVYLRNLRLSWDLNLDDDYARDPYVRTLLKIRGVRHNGTLPVTSAVPLPAAIWFFVSGLLGLAVFARGLSKD